ncbi:MULTISPECIES: alpha/beta hydrolase [unclassified Herbaspirillum]|uniref:PHA/PHB synthase family protein n=1 Tax=unclassified Herbaspirillum TaxID=2624150 RepID=UPI00115301B3|nr:MULTISPECIES: class I poly(R)-hydroxyalkanoic acid synthase [unclassified Herbaspirillum]TQK03634.1 polyhydroxyalkanoate synthase [Herbaspirillum sp. SJZ130]TQK08366.1 polyhydroxyalkanoate synthase [Herbaspirillum sp. SJZ106]
MNKQNPQQPSPDVSAWLAQMSDPKFWASLPSQFQSQFQHLQQLQPPLPPFPNTGFPFGAAGAGQFDPSSLMKQLGELGASLDAADMLRLQQDYAQQFAELWQSAASAKTPAITDRRLSAPAWQESPYFAFQAAAYELNSRFLLALADAVKGPDKVRHKLRFAVQQMIDAMSPANFLATNPVAQQKIIETRGESLTKGIAQLLADLQKGHISQTDETAFEVGKDVGASEGSVIYENELFQLIQYKPLTKTVHAVPLLIVPPCINKFYILDLQPQNSLVRYTVEQGHTVFLISWRNADASIDGATWEQYVDGAVVNAIHIVQEVSKQPQINALGFCVGGTILSCALALLAARGEDPVSSLTLLTTFLDFADTGAIDVYIDEMQLAMREQMIGKRGLMAGRDFSSAFSSLRPNDLLWNYVESNYLKGETPTAFDLLYWNADSTNLPGPMFCYYLRHMYLENALKDPGRLTVAGEKIDLRKITAPAFIYASREDHIVPWKSAYASVALLNASKRANNRFVLGASGHIAGVINPASRNKRNYWTNDKLEADPDAWLAKAREHPGSWWSEWAAFLGKHAGRKVAAPKAAGSVRYKKIEPAPGRYVKVKADQII